MSDKKPAGKAGRPSRTLDEEIAAAAEKLETLRLRKRELDRAARERNQKAIVALIRAEGLDEVAADVWKAAMPRLRDALKSADKPAPKATAQAPAAPTPAAQAESVS